jgi:sulfate adenylyltransferase subunit 1 (EFTu-like GTPase family)
VTGSVIFIDQDTNETVGAGIIKTEKEWKESQTYEI